MDKKNSQQDKVDNFPPFYVGQRVVCIDTDFSEFSNSYTSPPLVNDRKYIILGLHKWCHGWLVDVGISTIAMAMACPKCMGLYFPTNNQHWVKSTRFAPIQENFQSI